MFNVYLFIFVYIHIYIHTYIHIYIYIYIYIYANTIKKLQTKEKHQIISELKSIVEFWS